VPGTSDFSTAIGLIYDSALDSDAWPDALNAMARLLHAKDLAVGTFNGDTNFNESLNLPIDPDFRRSYFEHWADQNFLWRASAALPVDTLFSFECAGPREAVHRSAFYNEWFRPQGMDNVLGANLIAEGARSTVLTVYRPVSRPEFGPRDAARLRALLPHLRRAMRLRDEIPGGSHGAANFRALLDALDKPAFVVDPDAEVLVANGHAEALFRNGRLAARRRRLATHRPDETAALRALIRSAALRISVGGAGKFVVSREGAAALVLFVAPLPGARFKRQDRLAIVFVNDPFQRAAGPTDLGLLRAQFHLTKAEAELAAALLEGKPLRAAHPNATFATARTHLARVF
jgi:PAS domain-containing protein